MDDEIFDGRAGRKFLKTRVQSNINSITSILTLIYLDHGENLGKPLVTRVLC